MRKIGLVVAAALAAACGSRQGAAPAGGGGAQVASGGAPATAPVPGGDGPLTEADCVQLIDHILDLGLARQRREKKPEEVATEEQVAQIRARMHQQQVGECLRGYDRAAWRCAMAATTEEALGACDQASAAPAPPK